MARPVGLKIGGHWGPIFETRCSQHSRNTLLPLMCYHIKFRRCWSDILYVRIGVQKNSGDAVAAPPWDKGQETCTYPACVTVPISSLWVKPSGRRKRSQNFLGRWDSIPVDGDVAEFQKYASAQLCYHAEFGHFRSNRSSVIVMEICHKILTYHAPLYKVTRGH